jgi:hypothetical protein
LFSFKNTITYSFNLTNKFFSSFDSLIFIAHKYFVFLLSGTGASSGVLNHLFHNKPIQEIQPKQAKKGIPMQVKAVGVGVGLGIAALFNTACPQETETPKEYGCSTEDVHETFPCDCQGEDCKTKCNKYKLPSYDVIVIDETGGLLTKEQFGYIDDALGIIGNKYPDRIDKLINNRIKIIVNTSNDDCKIDESESQILISINIMDDVYEIASNINNAIVLYTVFYKNNDRQIINGGVYYTKAKPVITPRQLAAFEKANKTRNMIVGSSANRIRQRVYRS